MDINNVLEGTRQYFMGLPKQAQDGSGQPVWPAGAPPPEEGTPAQSGAPTPSSRPPSAAAAPPSTPVLTVTVPPRPPSEPIEPEPHIIHKATVMREAAEKRRELPEPEDEEEPIGALSPPSHIIRKPPSRALPSPAPAPAAPSPSPARPPSAAPQQPPTSESQTDPSMKYRPPVHRVQTPTKRPPDNFAPARPPDPYSVSRPPEQYAIYHYESNLPDGSRSSRDPTVASPQPSAPPRHSPQQTYARLSSSLPPHASSRLRESSAQSPPVQRYAMPTSQPPPPHNDRVPPIHHHQPMPPQRLKPVDNRTAQMYPSMSQRRDSSSYIRTAMPYDRHSAAPSRKYDPQQAYPGYRPTPTTSQVVQNHRTDTHNHTYKHAAAENVQYAARSQERAPVLTQPHLHDGARLPQRADYPVMNRTVDTRSNYHYPNPSTSSTRYVPPAPVPVVQTSTSQISQSRVAYRSVPQKSSYDYPPSSPVQSSPSRSAVKPGYPNQQTRMTVSVTTLVNQMNQTKHKRESPLDLSVKTVKNSADSSTAQDEMVESASMENKTLSLQARPSTSARTVSQPSPAALHKVDFAPDFNQYRERSVSQSYNSPTPRGHLPVQYNGAYENPRQVPGSYSTESRHHIYPDRSKYSVPIANVPRPEYVHRIDLTRSTNENRHENKIRDDRHFIIEERKRPSGPIVNNIPEKIVRYETWTADSRTERLNRSAREQHELMSQPVYSYSTHKRLEASQNEQRRLTHNTVYREHYHSNHRYQYPNEPQPCDPSEYAHYHDRNSLSNRHVIQKIPSHRDSHHRSLDPHNGVPADKRVLSILRNSLETKQTGHVEPTRPSKQIPDLIVIDDVDDSVIEITDLTKDTELDTSVKNTVKPVYNNNNNSGLGHHIQMPKAVDSIQRDAEYQKLESTDAKSKSPENDVSARIRTKAELKVMPPSQDTSTRKDTKQEIRPEKEVKLMPKSQKQHLFNQIREDNLRLESVIKNEKSHEVTISEIKTEPMNIDEIERDAEIPIKTENLLKNTESEILNNISLNGPDDLDWASACDNFMEQLKTGCHKKKSRKRRSDIYSQDDEENKTETTIKVEIEDPALDKQSDEVKVFATTSVTPPTVVVKQEPIDEDEIKNSIDTNIAPLAVVTPDEPIVIKEKIKNKFTPDEPIVIKEKIKNKSEKAKGIKKKDKEFEKATKEKSTSKNKNIPEKNENLVLSNTTIKKEVKEKELIKPIIKEESESTDDDEPLIKSKLLKEKEKSEQLLKYQLLQDLTEKSAYVKLECFDMDVNKNNRKSIEILCKDLEKKPGKGKLVRQSSRTKGKSLSIENSKNERKKNDTSSDSDDDDLSVASRLRTRKNIKAEDNKPASATKTSIKASPSKKQESCSTSASSTPIRKPGFGDGSDFHPGWEEELYRYKRSLRMPPGLIAIPRGRSGGPFVKGHGALFTRGSTSLPDLDPAPLSPAPSSTPSAATDDFYSRPQDKNILDSDLDSNSSCSALNRLQYDSEASTSTVFSSTKIRKKGSIVDVLIKKCGKKDDTKRKLKEKDEKLPKIIPKSSAELLPTPSLGLVKNNNKECFSAKKEKIMEDIYYLGNFRKETVTAFRSAFIKNTDGLIGAIEEFAPVVLKSRTRTESRVLKQRATIKEVFGDERPASAPPSSCRGDVSEEAQDHSVEVKKETDAKPKNKSKNLLKQKLKRRSNSIRDGLRSTHLLKRNDAKGRLLRLKKRNNLIKSLANKRLKDVTTNKIKKEKSPTPENKENKTEVGCSQGTTEGTTKRRFKRLFGRRKCSSGFDYIRKKKKIIRREERVTKIRRPAVKPSPESVHDIHKEIKGWFINKSIGETHLHRAARLGYTDCVAYCLEKMEAEPSAEDNAGYTPLHVAAARGHVRIARLLLQYGADVSAAAKGGIRPLHEACENCHVEMIRLLLAYGADPLLVTYAGQTPEELAEGQAALLLRLHISDVQGHAVEQWRFPPLADTIDVDEVGCDPLSSPPPASPPPPPDATIEIHCTDVPLPPFYSLRTPTGQPADGLWCLLQDVTSLLQIKSKESLLKQIHCGSGSPKELLREMRTQEFLERAQCQQLFCAGEKLNIRASKVSLVRVTDKLRQLFKIETVLVS